MLRRRGEERLDQVALLAAHQEAPQEALQTVVSTPIPTTLSLGCIRMSAESRSSAMSLML